MNGNISLNGISDATLIKILQTKEKHAAALTFNPQTMQVVKPNPQTPQTYSNVNIGWSDKNALSGVIEILKHVHEAS